jgi:hypothetical protein
MVVLQTEDGEDVWQQEVVGPITFVAGQIIEVRASIHRGAEALWSAEEVYHGQGDYEIIDVGHLFETRYGIDVSQVTSFHWMIVTVRRVEA